jgi:hypothetical protein
MGERPFLISAIVFHVLICYLVLLVPGVAEMRDPRRGSSSIGEQSQA